MSEARYLAVEGPIGVGSTSLAKGIARRRNGELFLDDADSNPWLRRFYEDPPRYALPAQLCFLRLRWEQQKRVAANAGRDIVCDYVFSRDELFAKLTLSDDELDLYRFVSSQLAPPPPKPDLVIYLQATPDVLIDRIATRARDYEAGMDPAYLQQVVDAYNQYFFHYKDTPLLVVNTATIDFVNNESDLTDLIEEIDRSRSGTRYYVATKRAIT